MFVISLSKLEIVIAGLLEQTQATIAADTQASLIIGKECMKRKGNCVESLLSLNREINFKGIFGLWTGIRLIKGFSGAKGSRSWSETKT